MSMKEQPRSIYRTMQGQEVDMNRLMNQNELTLAVGNLKVNARGDEIGPGGQILRKREDIISENNKKVPNHINVRQTKDVSDMDPEGNE